MLIRHPDSARGNDLYETPEVATLALLRAEPLRGRSGSQPAVPALSCGYCVTPVIR